MKLQEAICINAGFSELFVSHLHDQDSHEALSEDGDLSSSLHTPAGSATL